MVTKSFASVSPYGTVSTEFLAEETLPPLDGRKGGVVVKRYRYIWWPPKSIRWRLPRGVCLEFDCLVGADGLRRFAPIDGHEMFIQRAFHPGLEIIRLLQQLSSNQHYSYCSMLLLYNAVRQTHAHLDREFKIVKDLVIPRTVRQSYDESTVLPDGLGKTADGHGEKWTISQLLNAGQESAIRDGIASPSDAQKISYGLLEAARLNPLRDLKDEEIGALVRAALFDLPPGDKPTTATKELVADRILTAIDRHLEDSSDQFNAWFSGGHSNFLKTVADQPKQLGGKLDRGVVRRVYLESGWGGYGYVANCLEAVAVWFQRSLGDPLTRQEKRLFHHMYARQKCFGGLPLILLLERKSIIKPAILQIWANPNDREAIGVLHRLLAYYDEMVAGRRPADRRIKSEPTQLRTAHARDTAATASDCKSPPDNPSDLSAIVEVIRAKRKLVTRCKCGALNAEFVDQIEDKVRVDCRCGCGQIEERMTVTVIEIKSAGRTLGLDD